MTTVALGDPYSRLELQEALATSCQRAREVWTALDSGVFFAPVGDAWSPADNVRHLIKSNRPLERALHLSKLLLLLRFGPSFRSSRRLAEVVSRYHAALGGGLKAGRFTPKPLEGPLTADTQARLVDELVVSLEGVAAALGSWSERQLDWVRLPHPGLGLLTSREMVLFTIYHNQHHEAGVQRRLEADGPRGVG